MKLPLRKVQKNGVLFEGQFYWNDIFAEKRGARLEIEHDIDGAINCYSLETKHYFCSAYVADFFNVPECKELT